MIPYPIELYSCLRGGVAVGLVRPVDAVDFPVADGTPWDELARPVSSAVNQVGV